MSTRTSGRIIIPSHPADMLALAKKIYTKHEKDGEASPLNALQDRSWAHDGPKIEDCIMNHEAAEDAVKKAERHYRQRDVDLPAIKEIVRNSAALLKTMYAKNPKMLGEYGFEVDDSKQHKPKNNEEQ